MGTINLHERRALPPAEVAAVRPRELPAEEPEPTLEFVAEVAGGIFDKYVETKTTNEKAQFKIDVATAQQTAVTAFEANPGMSIDEMESVRKQMFSDIDTAKGLMTLPGSKQAAGFYVDNNTKLLNEQFTSDITEIGVQHELIEMNTTLDKLSVQGGKMPEIRKILNDHAGNLLSREAADAEIFRREQTEIARLLKAAKANAEAIEEEGINDAFSIWKQTVTPDNPAGDLNVAYEAIEKDPRIIDKSTAENDVETRAKHRQVQEKEILEQQKEADRGIIYDAIEAGQYKLEDGTVSTDIRALIESSTLDEDEQQAKWESAKKETDRKLKGEEIITDTKQRSQFYKDNMGILTGAVERDVLLAEIQTARFGDYSDVDNPAEPSLNEKDYAPLIKAINAQYEQGFGQMMSRVNTYAEGILLNPDSLGFIKNAPIRHKILGDFQEAWLAWIAEQGEKLKLSNIYPEGRRIAASYQVSDKEAERQETLMTKELEAKEQGRPKIEQRTEGETIQEYLKRTGK